MNKYIKIIIIITIILSLLFYYISDFLYELAQDIDKEAHRTKIKLIDHGQYSEVTHVQYSPEVIDEAKKYCARINNYSELFLNLGHYTLMIVSLFASSCFFHLVFSKINLKNTKRADNK